MSCRTCSTNEVRALTERRLHPWVLVPCGDSRARRGDRKTRWLGVGRWLQGKRTPPRGWWGQSPPLTRAVVMAEAAVLLLGRRRRGHRGRRCRRGVTRGAAAAAAAARRHRAAGDEYRARRGAAAEAAGRRQLERRRRRRRVDVGWPLPPRLPFWVAARLGEPPPFLPALAAPPPPAPLCRGRWLHRQCPLPSVRGRRFQLLVDDAGLVPTAHFLVVARASRHGVLPLRD